jgi:mannan endo-1,4-beta-mannosidase
LPWLSPPERRRARVAAALLVVALLAVSAGVITTPGLRWPGPGQSPEQIALQREQARAADLARQVHNLTADAGKPRPIEFDGVEAARADDLERQVEDLEDKLGIPRPPATDGVQKARADDLAGRLKHAEDILRQPRPPVTDGVAAARADDLAHQNDALEGALNRPRPPVDPLAGVTASMTRDEIAAARQLFGIYTTQSPFNYGEVDLVQDTVARKANLVGYFQSWRDPYNDFPIRNAWSRGQVPLLTWEPQDQVGNITADQPDFRLARIYGGAFDDYIRSYARGIKATGLPVVIRLAHEMNGNWYPWSEWSDVQGVPINGNAQGDYPKMWRHVHDIFAAEGANTQVIWLWSPNRVNRICGQRRPEAFYPGDDVVDWIGMSGYYRNYQTKGGACDDIGATFDAVFGNTLPELRRIAGNKPIFLSEIGATERGGDKARWIADLFRGLGANGDIVGFAWFSLAVSSGGENDRFTHDWRINSSGEAQVAMRDGLAAAGYGRAPG